MIILKEIDFPIRNEWRRYRNPLFWITSSCKYWKAEIEFGKRNEIALAYDLGSASEKILIQVLVTEQSTTYNKNTKIISSNQII